MTACCKAGSGDCVGLLLLLLLLSKLGDIAIFIDEKDGKHTVPVFIAKACPRVSICICICNTKSWCTPSFVSNSTIEFSKAGKLQVKWSKLLTMYIHPNFRAKTNWYEVGGIYIYGKQACRNGVVFDCLWRRHAERLSKVSKKGNNYHLGDPILASRLFRVSFQ